MIGEELRQFLVVRNYPLLNPARIGNTVRNLAVLLFNNIFLPRHLIIKRLQLRVDFFPADVGFDREAQKAQQENGSENASPDNVFLAAEFFLGDEVLVLLKQVFFLLFRAVFVIQLQLSDFFGILIIVDGVVPLLVKPELVKRFLIVSHHLVGFAQALVVIDKIVGRLNLLGHRQCAVVI